MKFTVLSCALFSTLATAIPFPITHTNTLNCRDKPSTSGKVVKTYTTSSDIKVTCQTYGETINGNNIWDKTQDGCYVSDYYVKTGVNGFIPNVPKCPGTKSNIPGPRVDDYKYKSTCGAEDPWRFFECQCVSFVAQRINERLGIHFTNRYKGKVWGYANQWDEAARNSGVPINNTPKPGCIAQTNAGSRGHVAWVSEVDGDYVIVEEYNYVHPLKYGVRKVSKSTFKYIHLTGST